MTVYRTEGYLQSEDCQGLVDTHCHLDLEPLYAQIPELLVEACHSGVTRYVVPGVHPDGWERMSCLARQHPGVHPAFGIHPMHADAADDTTLSHLTMYLSQGIAVGEIGLDPSYAVPMDRQEQAFRAQVRLAVEHGLPVLIHCRRAFQRTLQLLKEQHADRVGGVMHAFSGSPEMAREFIRLGFVISLSGTVTWETALRPVRLAQELPLDSLVLETDAPDLAPHPFRGQPNRPAWLNQILSAVARIRHESLATVAAATTATAQRVLKLPIIS